MSELEQLVDAFRAGELALGDLVDRLNRRGGVDDDAHAAELEWLDGLLASGVLELRLHRALRAKLAELQGPGAVVAAVADDDVATVVAWRATAAAGAAADATVVAVAGVELDDAPTRVAMPPPSPPSPPPVALDLSGPVPGLSTSGPLTGDASARRTGTGSQSQSSWESLSRLDSGRSVGEGSRLKDRFVLEKEIGRGGMGVVFRALDERKVEARDRYPHVAVKVLNDEFRRHPDSLIALQRESRRAQQLAHDNIVRVFDFDKDGAIVYMTMEYIDGQDLKSLLRDSPRGLPLADARPLIDGMARALERAHRDGVVHSDFKPGNVMVTRDGVAKVFDFGIARAGKLHGEAAGDQTVFDAGTLGALTPAYASPEMLQGQDPEPADDVYALGCVAYELLAGKHPFNKLPADQAQKQGLVPERIPGLSKRQWRALSAALAFDRRQRLANATALSEGLRPLRLGEIAVRGAAIGVPAVLAVVLASVGLKAWLHHRHVRDVESRLADGRIDSAAAAAAALATLEADDQARVRGDHLNDIKGIFYRTVDQHWNPDQQRYGYDEARQVVELAYGLYGADSAWVTQLRDDLQERRDRELSRLNDAFNRALADGLYARADDDGSAILAVLAAVRAIDPAQGILKDARLPAAFAAGVTAALEDPSLPPPRQIEVAGSRLEVARHQLNAAALAPLEASIASRRAEIVAAQEAREREERAVAEHQQALNALAVLLREASDSDAWRTQVAEAWKRAAAGSRGDDPELRERGATLATLLELQSEEHSQPAQLDEAIAIIQLGRDLLPDSDVLERRARLLADAKDKQIRLAATEAERARLLLQNLDQVLERGAATPAWLGAVEAAQRKLKGSSAVTAADLAARVDRRDAAIEKLHGELLAAGDLDRAADFARRAVALDAGDARLQALGARVLQARETARAARVERYQQLVAQKAFTPEWQAELATAAAAVSADDDPRIAASQQSLEQAYVAHAREQSAQGSHDLARQTLLAGLKLLPQSTPLKDEMRAVAAAEKTVQQQTAQQEAVSKIEELERTVRLKAGATEVADAITALKQLRALEPDNAFARDEAPQLIQASSQKLAERFVAKRDYASALKALDRGLSLGPSPALQQARLRTEVEGCAVDIVAARDGKAVAPARFDACMVTLKQHDAQRYLQLKDVPRPGAQVASAAPAPAGDPCQAAMAGKGGGDAGRCSDSLGGASGPSLVVVPGLGRVPAYAIMRYELSVGDFNAWCADSHACTARSGSSNAPVTNFTVAEAQAYAAWLSRRSGYTYRLPTEAEWLNAASAQGKGDGVQGHCRITTGGKAISGGAGPVTAGDANPWGLINVVGNVWELVVTERGGYRLRGAGYDEAMWNCSTEARRDFDGPSELAGLRLVRELR